MPNGPWETSATQECFRSHLIGDKCTFFRIPVNPSTCCVPEFLPRVSSSLDAEDVESAIRADEYAIVRFDLSGETVWARVSDFKRDTLKQHVALVEMTQLSADEPVVVDVTVEVHSKSALSRARGVFVQHLESVRIEGPVEVLPDVVHVDARLLKPCESMTLADLKLPQGCKPVGVPLETPAVTVELKKESAKTRGPAK